MINNAHTANIGYTSGGIQSNLQTRGSLARAVTVDNEVATNSRPLHTLNVGRKPKTSSTAMIEHILTDRKDRKKDTEKACVRRSRTHAFSVRIDKQFP